MHDVARYQGACVLAARSLGSIFEAADASQSARRLACRVGLGVAPTDQPTDRGGLDSAQSPSLGSSREIANTQNDSFPIFEFSLDFLSLGAGAPPTSKSDEKSKRTEGKFTKRVCALHTPQKCGYFRLLKELGHELGSAE